MLKKIKNYILLRLFYRIKNFGLNIEKLAIESINFKKRGIIFHLGKDYKIFNPKYMEFGESFCASDRFRIEAISNYEEKKFDPKIIIGT